MCFGNSFSQSVVHLLVLNKVPHFMAVVTIAVILEPVSISSPSIWYKVIGPNTMILVFWMLSFKPTFSLIDRRMLDPTKKKKKDTPCLRAKEKPQQGGRRGEITFRIKPHTHQRHSEGSNKTLCTPGDPTQTEPDLPWVSECLLWRYRSAVALQGQGLQMQQTWVWHKPSWRRLSLTPPQSCQNLHRTGETDSWRAQTKPCMHQDPGERSSDPRGDWPQTSLWVFEGLLLMCGLAVACHGDRGTSSSSPGRHVLA